MLKENDLKYVAYLLSPGVVIPIVLAELDDTRGAQINGYILPYFVNNGYNKIRGMIRNYLRYIKQRDNIKVYDLDFASSFRGLGLMNTSITAHAPEHNNIAFAHVVNNVANNWFKAKSHILKNPSLTGKVTLNVFQFYTQQEVDLACLKAISLFFNCYEQFACSFVRGRLHFHDPDSASKILLSIKYNKNNDFAFVSFDPSYMPLSKIKTKLFGYTRQFVKLYKTQPYVYDLSHKLMSDWAESGGLLYSPATASVACMGSSGVEEGYPALTTDFNGIALSVVICKLVDGKINICCNFDHRVWDGASTGLLYDFLKFNVPRLLEKEICG